MAAVEKMLKLALDLNPGKYMQPSGDIILYVVRLVARA